MHAIIAQWVTFLTAMVPVAIVAAGGWLAKSLRTPTELDRAQHLAILANDVATTVCDLMPQATWAAKVEQAVQQLSKAAGLPTTNTDAIRRAAVSGVARAVDAAAAAKAARP